MLMPCATYWATVRIKPAKSRQIMVPVWSCEIQKKTVYRGPVPPGPGSHQSRSYCQFNSSKELFRWMSGGGTVQYSLAPHTIHIQQEWDLNKRVQLDLWTPKISKGQWFLKTSQFLKGRKRQPYVSIIPPVHELESGCQSDRNLIGGAPDACNLLHTATLRLGGALHQCRAGIGHFRLGRHTDWVRGRGRGGARGGGAEGLVAVGSAERFHLDQLIPDFRENVK